MLIKTTDSSNLLFQICTEWKRGEHHCSFSWKCSRSEGNCVVA